MLSTYHDKKNEEGFTLIELLVVIIIIGILAAIAIPTFLGQRERARRGAVQSDLRNAAIVAETYFTDRQTYADFTAGSDWDDYGVSTGTTLTGFHAATSGFCIYGQVLDASSGASLLPGDDGDGWYYRSDQSPQIYSAAAATTGPDAATLADNCGVAFAAGTGTVTPTEGAVSKP